MSLAELWRKDPGQLLSKQIHQIIPFAGDGRLRDGSDTSVELRELLGLVHLDLLSRYADQCLQSGFPDSGLALQDIVNQVGTRLGFSVEYGRYRGVANQPGHDGLWTSEDGRSILVEVKTTDAYRIDLDTVAAYRNKLIQTGRVSEANSSILLVVGREDTGGLEAQVRGSKHAWDIRLISVEALLSLLSIKVRLENPLVFKQIVSILTPQEFTRVDGIIDIVFRAAEDAEGQSRELEEAEQEGSEENIEKQEHVEFGDAAIERVERALQQPLLKQTRVTWQSPDGTLGVLCKVSRAYVSKSRTGYWFSIHATRYQMLGHVQRPYLALGCGSADNVLLIPYNEFLKWVDELNITRIVNGEFYWHVHVFEKNKRFFLILKKGSGEIDLTPYLA